MRPPIAASIPVHEEREKARDLPPRGLKKEDVFEVSIYYAPDNWYRLGNPSKTPREYTFEVMGRRAKKWTGKLCRNGDREYIERFSPERILPLRDIPPEVLRRNKGSSLLRALREAIIRHIRITHGTIDSECTRITRKMVDIDEWHKE